jgi:outer membrane protein OmpA-like peptidoglycan-associated protein
MRSLFQVIIFLLSTHLALAQSQVYFKDNFDDNSKVWIVGESDKYKAEISNGNYLISRREGAGSYTCFIYADPDLDYIVEAKLKQISGPGNSPFGLVFKDARISKEVKQYMFFINGNGSFKIKSINKKTEESIDYVDWTKCPQLNTGFSADNILRIEKTGKRVAFFINGEKVYSLKDGPFWGEQMGFWANPNLAFSVDEMTVYQDRGKINLTQESYTDMVLENMGPKINSKANEDVPVISADGKTLYFIVKGDSTNPDKIFHKDKIWYSNQKPDGSWDERAMLPAPLNNNGNNSVVSVSSDNNTLILKGKYNQDGSSNGNGLSRTSKTLDGWEIPQEIFIPDFYNNDHISSRCMSTSGKILIFSLERDEGYGDKDLYVCFRQPDGSWSRLKNMGNILNTFGNDYTPFISADEKTLYYATTGKMGYGKSDIFLSRRLDDSWTNWSEPQNLGPSINGPRGDGYFTISASGDYAYLVSRNNSLGKDDIFRIKLTKSIKPEPVVIIHGKVFDKETKLPLKSTITYHDLSNNKEAGIAASDPADGSYKIVLPYGKAYGFLAEKKNYMAQSDNIDLSEVKEFIEIERDLYLAPIQIGESILLNNVFFVQSKAELLPSSLPELNRLLKILEDNPEITIEISGHTDNVGDEDLNMKLSEERAAAVQSFLTDKGISRKRLSGKGYGGTIPMASNSKEETRKLNRRVEFKITGK